MFSFLIFLHSQQPKISLILVQKTQIQNSKVVSKCVFRRASDWNALAECLPSALTAVDSCLGAMGVQENSGKMKWNSGGESRYPKTETLTSKYFLVSQICVQDSSSNKK